MKLLFSLALSALLSLAAFAAETPAPVVTITDDANCYVNGVNVGAPVDAIANNPSLAPAINSAFVAYHRAVQLRAQQLAQELAAAQAELATVKAERDALKAKYEPQTTQAPAPGPAGNSTTGA